MEVYAGFLEHTDHHVGRVIDAIDDLGVLDNTIIYYIIGDNGASAEGTLNGAFNEMANFNGMAALETPEFMLSKMDEFGSPTSYNHYAVGWAWAMDTPFQWTKQVASHWGGTRNGTIVHWPAGIAEKGGLRSQFTHVIDIAPTILEAAGLPEPTMVNGVQQSPIEGTSMLYAFDDADAAERHDLQYFEMFGNRGIYHKGWSAVTKHRTPWLMIGGDRPALDDDVWELYDGAARRLQPGARSRAGRPRAAARRCSGCWLIEAVKYNVLPIDDRTGERLNPDLAGRPTLIHGNSQLLFPGMGRLLREQRGQHQEQVVLGHGRDHRSGGGANGVIVAQGGRFGGWSLYLRRGRAAFRLQRPRHPRVHHPCRHRAVAGGHPPGEDGVRLRRRRSREGRRRHALLRRRCRRYGARRADAADDLLGRRDDGCRIRIGHRREQRLHAADEPLHTARSRGCRSTPGSTTTTTSSIPTSACGSRWRGSSALVGDRLGVSAVRAFRGVSDDRRAPRPERRGARPLHLVQRHFATDEGVYGVILVAGMIVASGSTGATALAGVPSGRRNGDRLLGGARVRRHRRASRLRGRPDRRYPRVVPRSPCADRGGCSSRRSSRRASCCWG